MCSRAASPVTARKAAELILGAHEDYRRRFRAITKRSPERFEHANWRGVLLDARERIGLYRAAVDEAEKNLKAHLLEIATQQGTWLLVKSAYAAIVHDRYDVDLAQTFFNSVARRFLFAEVGQVKFEITDARFPERREPERPVYRSYPPGDSLESLFTRIFLDLGPREPYEDLKRDTALVAAKVRAFLEDVLVSDRFDAIEVIREPLFRNKAKLLIGRIVIGTLAIPLAILFRRRGHGAYVHSVTLEELRAGRLVSNTRSNFHVDIDEHRELVGFLMSMLPEKHVFEIYSGLGYYNHARSKLYDELFRHLADQQERFITAPGARGKVLYVFTLPTYPMVFKIIRDEFEPPKSVTRRDVLNRYQFVKWVDRAGRLLDALTFGDVRFRKDQFEPEVLAELFRTAPSSIRDLGHQIEIKHMYVQKKVTPLPEYFRYTKDLRAQRDAVLDYGYLIKDLASVNIFLGDYLIKNFGVTSYGKVVGFDFDEIALLTEQRFRDWPKPRDDDDEFMDTHVEAMVVDETDVFPEQFEQFLGIPSYLMPAFKSKHADLFTAAYYRDLQSRLREDEVIDIVGVHSLYDTPHGPGGTPD